MNRGESYFIDEYGDLGRCLCLCCNWLPEFTAAIERENIKTLRLSNINGWKNDNLLFLKDIPNEILGIEIFSPLISDLTPLYAYRGLEYLSFQIDLKKSFNLSSLSNLRILKLTHSVKIDNFEECVKLEHLNISSYPWSDLKSLSDLQKLTRLQLMSRKLCSLEGIEKLTEVTTLDIAYCPNLRFIDGIEDLKKLKKLELKNCRNIIKIPEISHLNNLESIILEDCGEIDDLEFLSGSESLRSLFIIGNTTIKNGDLKPLTTLPKLETVRIGRGRYNLAFMEIDALCVKS